MADKLAPKKRGRKPTLDPEMVAAAMVELNGNISAVARRFNVHRFAVQNLIENRPALQKVLADIRKGMIDNVESRFYADCLKDGYQYQTSRIFFLKTQARERGYTEKDPELPPLEVLLRALPQEISEKVRTALAGQVHPGRDQRSLVSGETGRDPGPAPGGSDAADADGGTES